MSPVLTYAGFLMLGEVVIHLLFFLISKSIGNPNRDRINLSTVMKGWLERAFIAVVLVLGIASAITMLGALKIATRIKDEESKVSNDFFLMGNLVSVMFGIGYYVLYVKIISMQ